MVASAIGMLTSLLQLSACASIVQVTYMETTKPKLHFSLSFLIHTQSHTLESAIAFLQCVKSVC